MAGSYQHEKPPARVNLFLEVMKGDAKEKVELPLRLLIAGGFTGHEPAVPLADREVININKNNFQQVMHSHDLGLEFNVENRLGGEGDISVDLAFEDMDAFHPEQVARQIPELGRLLAARNLLQDLRNRLISVGEFRKQLERIVKDEEARKKLLEELDQVAPGAAKEEPAAADDETPNE